MESYVVDSIHFNTEYSENIIENKDVETSIIEPGANGNLMMIYLEPSYSQVKSVYINSSVITVPDLGETYIKGSLTVALGAAPGVVSGTVFNKYGKNTSTPSILTVL